VPRSAFSRSPSPRASCWPRSRSSRQRTPLHRAGPPLASRRKGVHCDTTTGGLLTSTFLNLIVVPAGYAPIDVTITPAAGSTGSIAAVRFWIGTEDAKGSVKAKAEVENAADPDRWHVHAEIPNPMPEGSMLWVEIEDDKGAISTGSFDLRM
jgi:hypothetical protein